MAEADGRPTGAPGVCLVTRGPGAANAAIGLHTAFQDSTPMVLPVGQVARCHQERETFQELDYRRVFGQPAKWTAQADDANRIAQFIAHAFHWAVNLRPGRVIRSALANPDFVAYARGFGAWARRMDATADFPAAFSDAQSAGTAAVIELAPDPKVITPGMLLPAT